MNQGWQKGFMEWRFISDRIHDALQYFDDGHFAECPLPEQQNYKGRAYRMQPQISIFYLRVTSDTLYIIFQFASL